MATQFPEVMTIEEVCQYLRIPRSSLYKLAQEGKIPCQKVGRHWRFRKATIDRWLDDEISASNQEGQTVIEDMHGK